MERVCFFAYVAVAIAKPRYLQQIPVFVLHLCHSMRVIVIAGIRLFPCPAGLFHSYPVIGKGRPRELIIRFPVAAVLVPVERYWTARCYLVGSSETVEFAVD